ncbi:biotin/methionine sulfoxide reductase [Rhizobiales bacterium GAS191]|nr:biotin/methionine sulfoxide reductase [Rhizobiales bacterium GAS191]
MDDILAPKPGQTDFLPHTSHWGVFSAAWRAGKLEVLPHRRDPDPNDIIDNFPDALRHPARIARPMIRRGWLERGPDPMIAAPPRIVINSRRLICLLQAGPRFAP